MERGIFMKRAINYPFSQVKILPGDMLYSPIGRSTYFVGHIVIIGSDYLVKESLPTRPSGYSTKIEHFWKRHRLGDTITLLRSSKGSLEAANWATRFVGDVKKYHLGNYNINNITKNYCSKFVVQAYYHGANVKLMDNVNCFLSPQYLRRSPYLERVAIFK